MARRHLFYWPLVIALIIASAGIPVESRGSAALQDQPPEKKLTAGRNVNMVSGMTLPNGDPYLQRQNEPSITVSTRNTLHLLAGSNDYRTVDMPLENEQLPGREGPLAAAPDAWLGLYKSIDGGQYWASTLLPGFPQDTSAAGMASPLKYTPAKRKGFTAAADPVVRSGPSGMFYYSGIAFNRTQIPGWVNGALFISRFIDRNDAEAGDAIQYIDTQVIATDNRVSSVFIDKPWIAVDAPQAGAKLTKISGQNIPRHNVYIAYSIFVEEAKKQTSSINFRQSTDCGKSWGAPLVLNQSGGLHQGATIAIDPRDNGNVYVAWRRFDAKKYTSAIMVARSRTKGATFESSKVVAEFTSLQWAFDQPATTELEPPPGTSFRTNSYPAIAVDSNGIVYVTWTQRGQGVIGDARILLATSPDGRSWTARGPVDSPADKMGHQFMPSLAFAAGKLTMAWYDQREDYCANNGGFDAWISDGWLYRHTIDVRAAQADTADFPNLKWQTVQISRYHFALEEDHYNPGRYKAFQTQWNPPNYPLFATGTTPFHGDYLDVAASPTFVRGADGQWRFNTAASDNALFHVAWTDNRDVRPPTNGDWTSYAAPWSPGNENYTSPGRPGCVGGQQPGMRNQNVYTAQLISGIEAGSPTNAKALDLDVPRAFAVFVKNNTWTTRSFRLTIDAQPPGGQASFLQFDLLEYLDVTIAPYSTISRQVFVNSTNIKASVLVRIKEIDEPDGQILPDGMTGSVLLNGDPTSLGVSGEEETHQPEIKNPHIRNWSVNALSVNPEIDNEDIVNTDIVNPNIVSLGGVDPDLVNPNAIDPLYINPHIRNTDYLNPAYVNPHIRNPHIRNESPGDVSVTDVEWPVTNTGNTASSFSFTLIAKEALPEGLYAQLIVYKVHYTPAVAGAVLDEQPNVDGCELKKEPHHEILLNIVNPDFVNPHIRNPNLLSPHIRNAAIENATFVLGPGEEAIVNLRIIESHEEKEQAMKTMMLGGFELPVDIASFVESVGAAVTAQSVDSEDAAQGIEEPKTDATALVISTSSLPPGTVGLAYPQAPYVINQARIQAVGGTPAYAWWVNPDELPPGLTFNASSGQISGTPLEETGKTYPRVFSFTVQVTDSGSPQQSANQRFSIAIQKPYVEPPPLVITTPSPLPSGTAGKPYGTALNAVGGIWPYRWTRVSGSLPPGLAMNELGTIGGTPSLAGAYTFSVRVTDSAAPVQFQEKAYSLTIRAADAPTFSISGRVTLGPGGASLPGVLMRGLPSAPTTDASGSYSDTVPGGWSGTVIPFKAGYYFVPAEISYANVQSHRLGQNYVAYPVTLDHFDISNIGNAIAGVPFPVTITAKDSSGVTVTTYTDTNFLSDTTGTVSPTMTGPFKNGVWTGQVAVMRTGQDIIIQTSGGGRAGQSNAFNVLLGPPSSIRIEDAPGGAGTEVVTKTLGPGHTLTVFAVSRDLGNNFVDNAAVVWSLVNKTPGIGDGDLVPSGDNMSAVFTAHAAGTARIHAQHASLGADATGTITVTQAQLDDPYEDNDDLAHAAPLSLGPHADLVLKDPDWFKITVLPADAGKDLMIHLKGVSYPDPDIRRDLDMIVLDGSGRMWSYNISGSDDEYAFIAGVAAGDYYIGQTYILAEGIVYSLTAEVGTDFGLGYIEGRLTTSNGYGLANILVELYGEPFDWNISRPMTTTDADGHYRIGYFPGKYTVRFNVYNPDPQQDPLVADSSYLGKTYNSNEVLTLLAGATVPGIDAQLEPGGIIWGRVTDSSGNGLSMARVYIHAGDGTMVTSGYTNVLGNYVADRIPTGNYKVRVRHDATYGLEWYGDSPSLAGGLPVSVMGGQVTSGVDVELGQDMAYLQGRVTDNLGNPISGVLVSAFDEAGINVSGANTDEAGNYLIPRLATGEVRIYFNASTAQGNYVSKYFPNEDLLTAAIPVPVQAGETTSGIDAQLSDGGTITGRVTDAPGIGIPGISIRCFDTNSDRYYGTTTDATGNYTLAHIRPDDYKVLFRPETGSLAAEWYNDRSSSSGARVVTVGAGQVVPEIDAQLNAAGGSISGTVTNGSLIKNMRVLAYDSSRGTLGAHISSAATDEAGNYRIPRLPGTNYKVYFDADRNFLGYNSEYYAGKGTFGQADVFPVVLGEETANISAIPLVRTPVDITTTSLPEGRQSEFYSASLEAAGGRPFYFWNVESGILPNGLTLNGKGEIRGNPTAAGDFNFTVRVTDSTRLQWFETQYDTQEFTITIAAYGGTGFVISGKVTAGGSPVPGVVMAGLPGSPATNALGEYITTVSSGWSGTVTPILGGYSFTPANRTYAIVTVNMSGEDYAASLGSTLYVSTTGLSTGRTGSSYGFTMLAQGGTPAYSWTIASGRLPDGLTLSAGGQISGTPTEGGEFPLTVRVTDSSTPSQSATRSFTLLINPDHQGQWTSTYPLGGQVNPMGLVFDPSNPNTQYAVIASRGIYRSTDGGGNWTNFTDNATVPSGTSFNPRNVSVFLVGNGSQFYLANYEGLFKSLNQGAYWTRIDSGFSGEIIALALDPADGNVIYAGTRDGKVYHSTNGGSSWSDVSAGLPIDEIRFLAVDPAAPSTIYAGTGSNGIYKSVGGGTWASINGVWADDPGSSTNLTRIETIIFNPANTQNIFIAAQDSEFGDGIYKTADGGATWSRVTPEVGIRWQPGYYVALKPGDPSVFYAVNGQNIRIYAGGGTVFSDHFVTAANLCCVVADPANSLVLYAGTDGDGVFKSTDGGDNWIAVNSNIRAQSLPHVEAHSLHFDAYNPDIIYAGSINGGFRSIDGGDSWQKMNHPNWQVSAFATHPSIPGTVFSIGDELYKSTAYGIPGSWTDPSGGTFRWLWERDIVIDPSNPDVLYAGVYGPDAGIEGVFKSTNGGETWVQKNNGLTDTRISALSIHPTDPLILFASTSLQDPTQQGYSTRLFRTLDGGESWQQVTCGLPDTLGVSQVVFAPSNPNVLYLSAVGWNRGLYKSTDGGGCWVKLNNINLNAVAVHPTDPNIVYQATPGSGVYVSFNGGQISTQYANGLFPRHLIFSIVLDPLDPFHVLIGTNGGVYETTFDFDIVITTTNLPDAVINQPYSATVKAAGGTPLYTWSLPSPGSLPFGIAIDTATGTLDGLPTSAGSFALEVKVVDSNGRSFTKSLTLNVLGMYSLATNSIPPDGGTVTRTPDELLYTQGAIVQVAAVPNPGYAFIGWSGSISGTASLERLVMMESKSIQANFAYTTALPDYYISSASFPPSAAAGQMIGGSVNIAIGNQGAGTVNPPAVWAGLYLSNDALVTPEDIPLWKGRISFVPPGSGETRTLTIDPGLQIPTTIAAGSYTLGVIVDDANAVVETNEGNNGFSHPITISATGTSHLELLGGWPYGTSMGIVTDPSRHVAVRGHGCLVEIIDIADPSHPTVISQLNFAPEQINEFRIRGNHVYLGGGNSFRIMDIADVHNPRIIGSCPVQSSVRDIEIVGDYAYVSDYHYGLRVVDISNPEAPTAVGFVPFNSRTHLLTAIGTTVYVKRPGHVGRPTGDTGLSIVDASNPAAPVEHKLLNLSVGDLVIDKTGQYLFLGLTNNYLHVYDISAPLEPVEKATFTGVRSPTGLKVVEDRLYVADSSQGRLVILDISNPLNPVEISAYQFPSPIAGGIWRPAVAGNLCLISSWYDSMRIIDFSILSSPVEVGCLEVVGMSQYADVSGNFAYVATSRSTSNRLKALDLSSLPNIAESSSLTTPYSVNDVVMSGIHAYLTNNGTGLHAVDVSDPAHPAEVGSTMSAPQAQDIVISGNYAYVADGYNGLKIFDIRTPAKPGLLGACPTPGYAYQLDVSGRYAYLACDTQGLRIIDISDPQNPHIVGSRVFSEAAFNVAVWQNHAYVVNYNNDILWVVDVSNPANPVEKATLSVYYCFGDIGFSGHYMFVPNTFFGIKVFDISDPANPVEVAIDRRISSPYEILVREDRIYVVNRDAGFYVLELRTEEGDGGLPPLTITTTSLPGGEMGIFYSADLQASGGRPFYYWSLESGGLLPNGLTLSVNGEIRGTPTAMGTFDIVTRVTDSAWPRKSVTQAFAITIGAYTGPGFQVSGKVMAGGTPVPGVVMAGLPGSPATNALGEYITTVSSGWSGTVTPTLMGYAFTPANRTYANVTANFQNQDYLATPGITISGTITLSGAPLPGVLMSGLPGEPRTNSSGVYSAAVPTGSTGWSGTVTPTLPGFTFNPPSGDYTNVTTPQTAQDYTATFAGGADDGYEENDSYETAAVITPGVYNDLVLRDADWFKVYVPASDAGKILRVHLTGLAYPTPTTRHDLDFYIIDQNRKLLSYSLSGGDDEYAYIPDLTEGWYFIGQTYISRPGIVYSLSIDIGTDFGLGFIEGKVMDELGNGIEGIYVALSAVPNNANMSYPLITTRADGTYKVAWTPGNYTIGFNNQDWNHSDPWALDMNYIGETYNPGQPIPLAAGSTVGGIDIRLAAGGIVTGRVTDPAGNGLMSVSIRLFNSNALQWYGVNTGLDGSFVIDRILTGNYKILFMPRSSDLASGISFSWFENGRSFDDASPVHIQSGQTTADINARLGLEPGGYVEGTVTNGSGEPIPSASVWAYDAAVVHASVNRIFPVSLISTTTDQSGHYRLGPLPQGSVKIGYNAPSGQNKIAEYFPGKLLFQEAEPVMVMAGQTTPGIDAQLGEGGTISGQVTDAAGNPLANIYINAIDTDSDKYYVAYTDAAGNYVLNHLSPDDYKLLCYPLTGNLAAEWFDNQGAYPQGSVLTVGAGEHVQGVNFQLEDDGAIITGQVTGGGGVPLKNVMIIARDSVREIRYFSSTYTDAAGNYILRGLPTGNVKLQFITDWAYGLLPYGMEYYNDKGAFEFADIIATVRGETTSGINVALDPYPALTISATSLPNGEMAIPYEFHLQASEGKPFYSWRLESGTLPNGLGLNGNGFISGVPTATGTYNFTVRVIDATLTPQSYSRAFTITIGAYTGIGHLVSGRITKEGPVPLPGVVLDGLPGRPVTNSTGEYVAVVPPGWSGTVSPFLGGYSFAPPARTYTNLTSPLAGEDYTAYIGNTLYVSTGGVPSGRTGSSYGYIMVAQGGTPPYAWTADSGRLPDGLTLNTSGQISGTPTEGGEFPWTVRVTDSSSPPLSATRSFNLIINPAHQAQWTTTYPLGGQVNPMGLIQDPVNPGTMYTVVNNRGIYRSTNGGANWTNFTETAVAGSGTWFDARYLNVFLIGSASQFYMAGNWGLFKSLNQGANWTRMDVGFAGGIIAMALDPADGNTIYAGTREGKVYSSTNGGTSWSDMSAGLPATEIRFLAVDPADPTKIYAGTASNGIYKSVGGGAWTSINGVWGIDLSSTHLTRVETIVFDPRPPAKIFIAANDSDLGDGIYKTMDEGATWSRVTPQLGIRWQPGYYIAPNPTDPGGIFVVNGGNIRIYSGDGTGYSDHYVTDNSTVCLAVDSVTLVLYAGTDRDGVFKSADGGQTWTAVNNNIRAQSFPNFEAHSLHIDASNPDIIYAGSIGGGYRSLDGGDSWVKMDHPDWGIRAFATHPSIPGTVFSVGNWVYKSTAFGNPGSWTDPSGGAFSGFWDSDLVIVPSASNVLYAGVYGPDSGIEGVWKSLDGGATWAPKNVELTHTSISTLAIHPSLPNILFASTRLNDPTQQGFNTRLFRTLDGGESWQQVTCGLPDTLGVTQIVFAPGDPNIMYLSAVGWNRGLYKSTDGGGCWVKLNSYNIAAVAVHPADPDIVFIGFFGSPGFYASFNGGQTWTQFNAGLHPNPWVDSIALDPRDPFHVFLGTNAGVYETTLTADMVITTTALPNAVINQAYSAGLKAAGGTPPYTWSLPSPESLPFGIAIETTTGTLNGQPNTPGSFALEVKVVDSNGRSFTKSLTLNVLAVYPLAASPAPPEGGTVTRTPDEPLYTQGVIVEITAVPNPGYAFIGWGGDISGTNPTELVAMVEDKSIQANFAPIAALPDYHVSSASFPATAAAGEIISGSVNITIGNLGSGSVNPPAVSAGVYLSNDALITPEDTPLWKGRVAFAPPGSGETRALPIDPGLQIPTTVAAGTYFIGVLVDDINGVVEGNESNNSFSQAITISTTGFSHLELLGGWPYGTTIGVDADESRQVALRGHGGLVEIVDISNPSRPRIISQLNFGPGQVNGIKIAGNLAYIAGGTKFFIADISDLHNPQIIGSCGGLESNIRDFDISGNYAYVSDYHYGLRVIDISTPTAPAVVGSLPLPDCRTRLIRAFGNNVYVTRHTQVTRPYGLGGLSIVDVSNPANPVERAFLQNLSVGDLAVDKTGQYLFLFMNIGLKIYDVSNPASPVEAASYGGSYTAAGIKIVGDRAYLSDGYQNRVFVLDITNPLSPVEISAYQFLDSTALARPAAAGNLCLVPSWYDALRIVDFSNPSSPAQVGILETIGLSYYADVANGQAYVATTRTNSNRLKILNLANLSNITQTASLETRYGINDVVADGIRAYLAGGGAGLRVIDVSDPAHPGEVGSIMSAPQAQDIVISGNYAYVADGNNGLKIFDIRTPGKPGLLGACPTPGYAYQLAVSGTHAYLACDNQGLRIIDISDPQNPHIVGSQVFSESAYNVAVWENHAYVVNTGNDILWVVDVSDPANPVEETTRPVYYCFGDIGFSGHYMFVSNTFFGLKIFDISDPANPVEVAIDRRLASACEVFVRENLIYVVDRDAGLYVLEFRTPILTETFESSPVGSIPSSWSVLHSGVSIATSNTRAYEGSKSLYIRGSPYNGANLTKSVSDLGISSGVYRLTFSMSADPVNWTGDDGQAIGHLEIQGYIYAMGISKVDGLYKLCMCGASEKTIDFPGSISALNRYEVLIDLDSKSADFYFNGTKVGSNIAEYGSAADRIGLAAGNAGPPGGCPTVYYDFVTLEKIR